MEISEPTEAPYKRDDQYAVIASTQKCCRREPHLAHTRPVKKTCFVLCGKCIEDDSTGASGAKQPSDHAVRTCMKRRCMR